MSETHRLIALNRVVVAFLAIGLSSSSSTRLPPPANSANRGGTFSFISLNRTVPCRVAGRTYQKDETWNAGHLRYKCANFGAYLIIGCTTKDGRKLRIGETYTSKFITHQCFRKGAAVYYREAACDLVGQPSCDSFKMNRDKQQAPTAPGNGSIDQSRGLPAFAGLPEGWKIVDANGNPLALNHVHISAETGSASGLIKVNIARKRETHLETGAQPVDINRSTGSLDARHPTVSADSRPMKPGTVAGSRSAVDWSGQSVMIGDDKRIAVGAGTFVFGRSPTGTFAKPLQSQ